MGRLDLSWGQPATSAVRVGERMTAEAVAVDLEAGEVRLSMAATENPELWAFLKSLSPGQILSGEVAAIERFGVFVALDDGPPHPVFPGGGFITIPELSWRHLNDVSNVVRVGQRVSRKMLQFDTSNGEARLSLRATQPDPFHVFADRLTTGRRLRGRVTELAAVGAFVEVADGVEGLVPLGELDENPVTAPEEVVQVGDEVSVLVTEFDLTKASDHPPETFRPTSQSAELSPPRPGD
ncbi:S1 RNA-binding domain-containing protein [Lentzea xinjiangensis]|uniref:S1 RNA-binding domain-containing protein n=1 Tax=Lentzea xinjiangensis TaxID=402600 RepID=UPI001C42F224|nr:S1 RNA-binding domain-containing protein [Lentzea xinjiangensis]